MIDLVILSKSIDTETDTKELMHEFRNQVKSSL